MTARSDNPGHPAPAPRPPGLDRAAPQPNHAPDAPPRRSQAERRNTSRAAIIAAARAEFVEHGYQAVSLGGIAARAGMTRGAIYHLFQDKSCVFREIVEAESEAIRARLAPALTVVEDPLERLRAGFALYLDAVDDVRVLKLIHVDYPDMIGPARWTLESPWIGYAEALLKEAAERGLLRPFSIRTMTRLMLAFYREAIIAIVYSDDPALVRREMAAALDVLIDGMRAPPGP
jgi:AcrR family transcriptional regulator